MNFIILLILLQEEIMSDNIYEIIKSNIRFYRKKNKITQNELSERTGFTHEYIRRLESSKYNGGLSIDSLNNISKALNVPITKFMVKNNEL